MPFKCRLKKKFSDSQLPCLLLLIQLENHKSPLKKEPFEEVLFGSPNRQYHWGDLYLQDHQLQKPLWSMTHSFKILVNTVSHNLLSIILLAFQRPLLLIFAVEMNPRSTSHKRNFGTGWALNFSMNMDIKNKSSGFL